MLCVLLPGRRRLHTVIERILSDISFSAPDLVEAARRWGHAGGHAGMQAGLE